MNRINELYEYRDMIFSMVKRELRGKYQRSVLGVLWTMINPLFQIVIYTIVFTYIFPSSIEDYYIYLMTGLIPWTFFSESLAEGASSIITNGDLTRKIYFPRDVLVISKVTAKFVNFLLAMIVVMLFLLFSGHWPGVAELICLPLIFVIEYFMTLGVALVFSAITVYFRDMEYLVNVILMVWIWATPVMYSLAGVKTALVNVILLNPLSHVLIAYRNLLYYNTLPTVKALLLLITASILMTIVGEVIFVKLEGNFAEEL